MNEPGEKKEKEASDTSQGVGAGNGSPSDASQQPADPAGSGTPSAEGTSLPPKPKISRKELRRELKAAKKQARTHYDQLVHLQADFENLKKRLLREREDYIRQAKESLIREVLPSLDNLEYALRHAREREEESPLLNGVEMTYKGLLGALRKFGVEPIESLGAAFDPNFHEAIAKIEMVDGKHQVIEEHQKGYLLDRKLLRAAMVTIAIPPQSKTANG